MEELGGVLLSHSGSLECLEEVVIYLDYLNPRWTMTSSEVKMDKEKMWRHIVGEEGRWDMIEQQLVRRGGPLQGWKVSRRIAILGDLPICGINAHHLLTYLSSTFTKSNGKQTAGESESLPVPTLMVQHVT
jgi:hypothetical protein